MDVIKVNKFCVETITRAYEFLLADNQKLYKVTIPGNEPVYMVSEQEDIEKLEKYPDELFEEIDMDEIFKDKKAQMALFKFIINVNENLVFK
jgi:hypothetical protein